MDFAKHITPNFGLAIGETFSALSDTHEAIVSLGLDAEVAAAGSGAVGGNSFSTWTPGILFGKGFGDLPEALQFLKLALTGLAGIAIPAAQLRRLKSGKRTATRFFFVLSE